MIEYINEDANNNSIISCAQLAERSEGPGGSLMAIDGAATTRNGSCQLEKSRVEELRSTGAFLRQLSDQFSRSRSQKLLPERTRCKPTGGGGGRLARSICVCLCLLMVEISM